MYVTGTYTKTQTETLMSLCLSLSLWSSIDDPFFLACKRGDLLLVDKNDKYSHQENIVTATIHPTTSTGVVHKDILQFLPTLTMPTDEVLVKLLLRPILLS